MRKRVDFVDTAANLSLGDEPRSVRTIVVQIMPSAATGGDGRRRAATGGGGFRTQQALQLDRSKPLPNVFGADHGITGRVRADLPNGEALSYVCSSVE